MDMSASLTPRTTAIMHDAVQAGLNYLGMCAGAFLAGVHPEAPETLRRGMTFTTPASVANAYAGTLIQAALTRTSLPHY